MSVPGTVFAERWEVVAPLASGSTSEVYRGVDRQTGEATAIKVMRPEYAARGESLQRFQREARVAQMLTHPHIVAVRDFGVDGAQAWIAMELLEGETLETRLERERLPVGAVLEVIDQVASAVDHAHAAGVVHRDMKPDNVFLLAGDAVRVKVLDFGFAKLLNTLASDGLKTASNALLGTPLYMAPEQIRSSATVDSRADLWSLGVVAYELLTGAAPFDARATADLLVEILTKPVEAPSRRDAAQRYPTATELARALRASMDPSLARLAGTTTAPHAASRALAPRKLRAPRALQVAGAVAVCAALLAIVIRLLRS